MVCKKLSYHKATLRRTGLTHFPVSYAKINIGRAGAILRVGVWDWDRGSADDSLGSFEVEIGEELLSKKVRERQPSVRRHGASGETNRTHHHYRNRALEMHSVQARPGKRAATNAEVARRRRCARVFFAVRLLY